jgi:hypothetical protein
MNKKTILISFACLIFVVSLIFVAISRRGTNTMKDLSLINSNSETGKVCYTGAECSSSEICECPSSSPTGNCNNPGTCKPRSNFSANDSEAAGQGNLSGCRNMNDIRAIPKGYYPTTVQWQPTSPQGDLVCINPIQGKEFQVVNWKGFPLPEGYYILYQSTGVNTTFYGCAQWSEWQGQYTCINSWTAYQMRKNEE